MTQQIARTDTASSILAAAKQVLLEVGYARFSTRIIAERAGVPLSQIHYHFGSKQRLVLAVLEVENQRLLDRQERMFESEIPIWMQWERACDFLEEDLASGYVRVLHEMIAAGWSDRGDRRGGLGSVEGLATHPCLGGGAGRASVGWPRPFHRG